MHVYPHSTLTLGSVLTDKGVLFQHAATPLTRGLTDKKTLQKYSLQGVRMAHIRLLIQIIDQRNDSVDQWQAGCLRSQFCPQAGCLRSQCYFAACLTLRNRSEAKMKLLSSSLSACITSSFVPSHSA